jgi:3-methyladenine DNA glycosylase AlkC
MKENLVALIMREINDLIDQRVQTKLEEYISSMSQQKEDKKYYDRKELAQKLNRTVGTIDRWVRTGLIEKEKIGKKTYYDINKMVNPGVVRHKKRA